MSEINLSKFGVEFLGTFMFLSVILSTGNPIAISIALLAMIYFAVNVSGSHFNPAVSVMFWTKGDLSTIDTLTYITAQILGGLCAYLFYDKVVKNKKL
jgi:glycerol uptake facilitator-like aquaporin